MAMVTAFGLRLTESLKGSYGRLIVTVMVVALAVGPSAAAHSGASVPAAAHLYWANYGTGTIVEANPNGTHPRIVNHQDHPYGVAANSRHLYWANATAIVEADLNGTHAMTIAKGQNRPGGVAVHGNHLY